MHGIHIYNYVNILINVIFMRIHVLKYYCYNLLTKALHFPHGKSISRQMGFNKTAFFEISSSRVFEDFCWVIVISFCRLTSLFLEHPALSLSDRVNCCASIISQSSTNFWIACYYHAYWVGMADQTPTKKQFSHSHMLKYKKNSSYSWSVFDINSPSTEI